MSRTCPGCSALSWFLFLPLVFFRCIFFLGKRPHFAQRAAYLLWKGNGKKIIRRPPPEFCGAVFSMARERCPATKGGAPFFPRLAFQAGEPQRFPPFCSPDSAGGKIGLFILVFFPFRHSAGLVALTHSGPLFPPPFEAKRNDVLCRPPFASVQSKPGVLFFLFRLNFLRLFFSLRFLLPTV